MLDSSWKPTPQGRPQHPEMWEPDTAFHWWAFTASSQGYCQLLGFSSLPLWTLADTGSGVIACNAEPTWQQNTSAWHCREKHRVLSWMGGHYVCQGLQPPRPSWPWDLHKHSAEPELLLHVRDTCMQDLGSHRSLKDWPFSHFRCSFLLLFSFH